jgi:predicted RNA-binding Zn ribbon-like protein
LPVQLHQQNSLCWYDDRVQSVAEIPFIAGHVALDFVNTAEGRGHADSGEALHAVGDLQQWGERRGVIAASVITDSVNAGDDELSAALQARELLYRLFLDQTQGRRAAVEDLATLEGLVSGAYQVAHLDQAADGRLSWSWDRAQLSTVRYVVVTSALALLSQSPSARLKQCPGDDCGWFFIDTTKRGNRRWCSMSECGQEAKTARRRVRPATHRSLDRSRARFTCRG